MKKRIALLMCLLLMLPMAACGGGASGEAGADSETATDASGGESAETSDGETADASSGDGESGDGAISEVTEEVDETEELMKHGMTLDYDYIEPTSLDNTPIGWGMGPDRDELNRPITALQYEEEYADYNVDFIVPSEEKRVYLTFDEGYENGFTEGMLDTLKAHNALGIFFVTKPYVESNPKLVRRMIKEGHVVGNHTVHHPSDGMPEYSIDYQTNEVTELHEYVKKKFDYDMYLFRYPTGKFSKQSLAVISNCGYRSVFWSFAYADWDRDNQPDPTEALQNVESKLHPGAIYLLHAVSQTNATILDDFLTYIEDQGYEVGNYAEVLMD